MPGLDPDEKARRAVVRAVNFMTPDFVKIQDSDPNDQNPSPSAFKFTPTNLLNLKFNSNKVNIKNQAQTRGFVKALKDNLPAEIRPKVQEVFGDLNSGVKISSVFLVISDLLAELEETEADG